MKRRVLILVAICSSLIYMSSCDSGSTGATNNPVMYGLVNSSNWRSPDPHAILTDYSIKIYGTSSNGQTIIINVNSGELGEYVMSPTSGHYAEFIPNMSSSATRYSTLNDENGSGFVRVSSIDEEAKTMSGNYYFKAYRTTDNTFKTISDGNFSNVTYQYYNISDTASFDNLFVYTANDEQRTAASVSAIRNDTAIVIVGEVDNSISWESVTLCLPPTISAGVHYINEDDFVYANFQDGFYDYSGTNGSVTIVENNSETNVVRGTFFFNYIDNASQTLSITSGQFEIEYEDLTETLE